jgi:hypothetical protein
MLSQRNSKKKGDHIWKKWKFSQAATKPGNQWIYHFFMPKLEGKKLQLEDSIERLKDAADITPHGMTPRRAKYCSAYSRDRTRLGRTAWKCSRLTLKMCMMSRPVFNPSTQSASQGWCTTSSATTTRRHRKPTPNYTISEDEMFPELASDRPNPNHPEMTGYNNSTEH